MSNKINQPNAIIITIYDVLSPFEKHLSNLELYFEDNLENYVKKNSKDKKIIRLIKRIRKEEPIEAGQIGKKSMFNDQDTDDEVIDKIVKYIFERSKQPTRQFSPISLVKDWLWSDGLMNGDLKSLVYDHVPEILDKWRMKYFIKLFTISEANSNEQRLFLQSTQHGDLTKFFNNYMQYFKESRSNREFYKNVAKLLRDSPSNLLFITTELKDALSAKEAGLRCIIVRKENSEIKQEHGIKIVDSLKDIDFILDPNRPVDCC